MRWPWQRAARTASCPQPRLLPSATPGVPFEGLFVIRWRPTWRRGTNLDEQVRCAVLGVATERAGQLSAADLHTAQDSINAALSDALVPRGREYRVLSARVTLRLSAGSAEVLAQRQADEERVRRLRFLKRCLYDHPDLVVLDRLEQQPGSLGDEQAAELQRIARWIKSCNHWWHPLLQQWEQLGAGFDNVQMQHQAMLALLEAVKALNGGSLPDATPAAAQHPQRPAESLRAR